MSQNDRYRYPGARPFGDSDLDRKLFFGRHEQIDYLFHSILVENLFVLYAKSGMGKTSLLNAGVMERLRNKGFFPMTIRLNDSETTPLESIYRGIEEAVKQRNKTVSAENRIDYEPGETDTLWQFFKTAAFWSTGDRQLQPVLILDQFEEFFTLHPTEHRTSFISQLSDLVRGRVPEALRNAYKTKPLPYSETPPQVKIVISMREDFLGHLDELNHMIPTILRARYRLMPLTCNQARDAIIKPAQLSQDDRVQAIGFSYTDETVDEMLDFLSERIERNKTIKTNEVEPFQLQLLCRHIEEKVDKKGGVKTGGFVVQKNDLGGKDGMKKVLQGFYENHIRALKPAWKKARVRNLCENGLIDNNLRLSLEKGYIERNFKVSPELLSELVDSRLLRSEPRVGSLYYELSHDTLVQPILQSQRERKIRRNWITVPLVLIGLLFVAVLAASRISKNIHVQELYKEAVELKKKGNYNAAVEYYRQILEIDEKHAAPYMELGELRELQKFNSGAIAVYEKAIDMGIKSEVINHRLGHLYAVDNKLDKAVIHYEKAIDINPDRTVYYTELGDIHSKRDDFAAAEKSYKDALGLDERNPDALKGLLMLYIRHDSLDDAVKIYKKARGDGLDSVYTIVSDIALQFRKDGRFGELERLYYIVSEDRFFSRNKTFLKNFAELFAQLNEYREAAKYYEKALYPGCKSPAIYKGLAIAYLNMGKPGKTVEVYRKAVNADPGNVKIFADIAGEMKNRGMTAELERLFQTASSVQSDSSALYEKLGTAYYYLEELDRAAKNYKKALTLDNKNAEAYKGSAVVQVYQGNLDEALNTFRRAVDADLDFAAIYRDIAWAMKQKKDADKLEPLLEIAYNVDSNSASFYDKLGRDYSQLTRYDRAIDVFNKALRLDKKHASVYSGLASAYIKTGNTDKALDVYRDAVKANPDFAGIYTELYRAYGSEQTDDRIKLLEAAFEVRSDDASYYEKLAGSFKRLKKYNLAIDAYKKALHFDTGNSTSYKELGIIYVETETPEKALHLFKRAIKKVHFGLADILVNISAVMWQKKMVSQRETLLEIAAGARSREASFYETLGFYFLADRARSIKFYEKAVELDDGNIDYYNTLAILYIEEGRPGKVIDLFHRIEKARANYNHFYQSVSAKLKQKNLTAQYDMLTRAYQETKARE